MKTIASILLLSISIISYSQKPISKEKIEYINGQYLIKDTKGLFSGKYADYHPNGKIACITTIKNGKKSGKVEVFYDSGIINVIVFEDENHENYGKVKVWNEDGTVAFKGVWKEGRLYKKNNKQPFTGTQYSYYKNGQIAGESEFKNGRWDGKQTMWDREGKVTSECLFRDNKIVDCEIFKK